MGTRSFPGRGVNHRSPSTFTFTITCVIIKYYVLNSKVEIVSIEQPEPNKMTSVVNKGYRRSLCARQEGMWEEGGVSPLVLNLGTRWFQMSASHSR